MSNYEYDSISPSSDFRLAVIGVLVYTDWLERYGPILLSEHFVTDDEKEIVKWINQYYNNYATPPTLIDLSNELNDNPIMQNLSAVSNDGLHYAADYALDFARNQAMKIAVLQSVDDIKKGTLDNIISRVEGALRVGTDQLELGYDLVNDAEKWLYDELHGKRFPTGWPTVDSILGGGLVAGEYGLLMAPTGKGKSCGLVNIGYAAAGLIGTANVTHITLELPVQKVLKRYAMRMLGRPFGRGQKVSQYANNLRARARQTLRAHVRVVMPDDRSLGGIRRLIDNLAASGFATDMLVVDYADLLNPPNRREYRFELTDVAKGLREIGMDYDVPVWSATQAGRHATYAEYISVGDISEAIGKAQVADTIIAICQTKDEEELGHGRLFMTKVRDAESNMIIPVKLDFERQAILQRGDLEI